METLHALLVWQSSVGPVVGPEALPSLSSLAALAVATFALATVLEGLARPVLREANLS